MEDTLKELLEFADRLDAAGLLAAGISLDELTESQRYVYDIRYKAEQKAWIKLLKERDKKIRENAITDFKKTFESVIRENRAGYHEFINRDLEDGWNAALDKVVELLTTPKKKKERRINGF